MMALTACEQKETFTVQGSVEGAQDSVMYFEQTTLTGLKTLDSTKIGDDGKFIFQGERPKSPEFFILRIKDQIINISIDSTETVSVKAQYPNMSARYEVEGSENCQRIRELALRQQELQRQVIALQNNRGMSIQKAQDSLSTLVENYKAYVTENYIFKAPEKASSYFALFQTLGQWLIFDPSNSKSDMRVFAAVATCWDSFYPEAERTQNLHNIAIEGMKNQRIISSRQQNQLEDTKVVELGVIELTLPDNHQQLRTLTSLKGKVVLLDFHTFTLQNSPQRILMLRDLYNKYHEQGLEIYQVALDQDEHFWLQMTQHLPWISVRDESGQSAVSYNIQEIPEFFLIDRQNQLYKRSSQMKDVEAEIRTLLSFRAH
jgi:peroxiredoxin